MGIINLHQSILKGDVTTQQQTEAEPEVEVKTEAEVEAEGC